MYRWRVVPLTVPIAADPLRNHFTMPGIDQDQARSSICLAVGEHLVDIGFLDAQSSLVGSEGFPFGVENDGAVRDIINHSVGFSLKIDEPSASVSV